MANPRLLVFMVRRKLYVPRPATGNGLMHKLRVKAAHGGDRAHSLAPCAARRATRASSPARPVVLSFRRSALAARERVDAIGRELELGGGGADFVPRALVHGNAFSLAHGARLALRLAGDAHAIEAR